MSVHTYLRTCTVRLRVSPEGAASLLTYTEFAQERVRCAIEYDLPLNIVRLLATQQE